MPVLEGQSSGYCQNRAEGSWSRPGTQRQGDKQVAGVLPSPSCIKTSCSGPPSFCYGSHVALGCGSPCFCSCGEPACPGALRGTTSQSPGNSYPGTAVSEDRDSLTPVSSLAYIYLSIIHQHGRRGWAPTGKCCGLWRQPAGMIFPQP